MATASMAAMTALVWSRSPTETRAQIMSRLVANSSGFGWGRLNVV